MNVLACSYHCWFPGRLNGQCSGAVRMNVWPLSSYDNLLPTYCSNPPPGAIDLALIDSFSFFLSLFFFISASVSVSLSLRSLCPGQKDQTGGDGRLPQQPTTWRAKRRKRRPQSRTGWVSSFFFGTCICECVSVMLITTRITLLNTSVMPSQYNLSSCVYEPGWLKPGCDITSAACMFPLRDS